MDCQAAAVTSKSLSFNLIGKLLAPRFISGDVMHKNFKAAWSIPNGLVVEKLGPNLFLFSLNSEAEQARVLNQGSWLFEKKFLLLLSKPIPMVKPTPMVFKDATFWVHFCELSMDLYNRSMAERFGNAIGRFVDYDNGRGFGWKECLRVRVILDIGNPLRRGIKVRLAEPLGSIWMPIRSEKLPELCSFCGRIGHQSKDCVAFFLADDPSSQKHQYGMWMQYSGRSTNLFRSPSTSPLGKNSIMVYAFPTDQPSPVDGKMTFEGNGSAGLTTTANGSAANDSSSRPMDISPVPLEEVAATLMVENLNDKVDSSGINGQTELKAKKKLTYSENNEAVNLFHTHCGN